MAAGWLGGLSLMTLAMAVVAQTGGRQLETLVVSRQADLARDSSDTRPWPKRPSDAPKGRALLESISGLPRKEREERIVAELSRGNLPEFLRKEVPIRVRARCSDGAFHEAVYRVMADYLAVGSDGDFCRVPLTPASAQVLADRFGYSLPTRLMVGQIHTEAKVKLEPRPLTEDREALDTFLRHHDIIEVQRGDRMHGALISGIKKDVVITPRLEGKPNRVAIFGWHRGSGKPIQPLYTGHVATYVDYSHGIRLVALDLIVDGKPRKLGEILVDPILHTLLSDEGPIPKTSQRYAP